MTENTKRAASIVDLSSAIPGDGPGYRADDSCSVLAYTRDAMQGLRTLISYPRITHIVGCVAWLTYEGILRELAKKRGVSIVVQKEDWFRSDGQQSWSTTRALYDALTPIPSEIFFREGCGSDTWTYLDRIYTSEVETIDAVRCCGIAGQGSSKPKMHHKFLVGMEERDVEARDGTTHTVLRPIAVATGSLNPTKTGERSLENVVIISSEAIADQFFDEWMFIVDQSEPLDWTSVEPKCGWEVAL